MNPEWDDQFFRLEENLLTILAWPADHPDLLAQRCEHSSHRTLAHLRACQEQWLIVLRAFLDRESSSVKILHPWRVFESERYAVLPWEVHLEKFVQDRTEWLQLKSKPERDRGGKWNGKEDTTQGLTFRLESHETYHLNMLRRR